MFECGLRPGTIARAWKALVVDDHALARHIDKHVDGAPNAAHAAWSVDAAQDRDLSQNPAGWPLCFDESTQGVAGNQEIPSARGMCQRRSDQEPLGAR